jgi:hypothetical protein
MKSGARPYYSGVYIVLFVLRPVPILTWDIKHFPGIMSPTQPNGILDVENSSLDEWEYDRNDTLARKEKKSGRIIPI